MESLPPQPLRQTTSTPSISGAGSRGHARRGGASRDRVAAYSTPLPDCPANVWTLETRNHGCERMCALPQRTSRAHQLICCGVARCHHDATISWNDPYVIRRRTSRCFLATVLSTRIKIRSAIRKQTRRRCGSPWRRERVCIPSVSLLAVDPRDSAPIDTMTTFHENETPRPRSQPQAGRNDPCHGPARS